MPSRLKLAPLDQWCSYHPLFTHFGYGKHLVNLLKLSTSNSSWWSSMPCYPVFASVATQIRTRLHDLNSLAVRLRILWRYLHFLEISGKA